MWRKIWQKLARLWYKLVTLKSSPRRIALGFAIGVFISYTPTFGLQTVIAIGVAALLRLNPIATIAGTYVTNIVTAPPLYMMCYEVGRFVLGAQSAAGDPAQPELEWSILRLGWMGLRWAGVEMVGALIVGVISAVPSYFLVLFGVVSYRRARLNRRIQKMPRRIEQGDAESHRSAEAAPPRSRGGPPADGREADA